MLLLGHHPTHTWQSRVAHVPEDVQHGYHVNPRRVTLMHHLLVQALPECAKNVWGGTEAVQDAVSQTQVSCCDQWL